MLCKKKKKTLTSKSGPGEEPKGPIRGGIHIAPWDNLARAERIFHSSLSPLMSSQFGKSLGGYTEVPLLELL